MQYILTEEEYSTLTAQPSNDNPKADNYEAEVNKMRTKYRSKELALYQPEQFDGFIRVGNTELKTTDISTLSDDEWDAKMDEIDAEFAELNEPLPINSSNDETIDELPKNENLVTIQFSLDKPFAEDNVSKSVIRFYPKVFEKQANVLDHNKFKIVDTGEVQGLYFTIYTQKK